MLSDRARLIAGVVSLLAFSTGAFLSANSVTGQASVGAPGNGGVWLFCLMNGAFLMTAAFVLKTVIAQRAAQNAARLHACLAPDILRQIQADLPIAASPVDASRLAATVSPETLIAQLGDHIVKQNQLLGTGLSDLLDGQTASIGSAMYSPDSINAAHPINSADAQSDCQWREPDAETLQKLRAELAALQDQFNTDLFFLKKYG